MKKFVFYLILYIGSLATVFNPAFAITSPTSSLYPNKLGVIPLGLPALQPESRDLPLQAMGTTSHPYTLPPKLAITASFDNAETLRTTTSPDIIPLPLSVSHCEETPLSSSVSHCEETTADVAISPSKSKLASSVPLPRGERTGEGDSNPSLPQPPLPFEEGARGMGTTNSSLSSSPHPAAATVKPATLPLPQALLFGLILPLCPGVFYLIVRLIHLLWTRPDRRRILFRYGTGTALGLTLLAAMFHGRYWSLMYENAALTTLAGIVTASMLAECAGHMDFALFRPLRGKLRRGFLIGIFAILLLTGFPMPLSAPVFSIAFAVPAAEALKILACVWLGLQVLPLAALLWRRNAPCFLLAMQRLNILYNLLYLFGALCLIGASRSETAAWLAAALFALTYFFWRAYPVAIAETIRHTRSKRRQQQLFYKVQQHAAYIILCISALAAALSFYPKSPEPQTAPLPAEIIARFAASNQPILVTVSTNWSPLTPANAAAVNRLPANAAEVINIPAVGTAREALPWLKAYNSLYAPQNVLFTARHPYGLKLPANLSKIDWQTALATFENTPATERTNTND